ncbi:hypothetical protein MKW94_029749 [Papaver nudicaule]|uniref:Uncharacterized protein n=1 Tax=Papaver nudicaule TaxID=74823 RepID=A0AA41V3D9_PAPNU|nr:hypothetical protein [Papaver nudicaule]
MAGKVSIVFFILAVICLTAESSTSSSDMVVVGVARSSTQTCNGLVGECIDGHNELIMDSEIHRRSLFKPKRGYISYEAIKKNSAPCGHRGRTYYGCTKASKANPYHRGCSVITHCARIIR